MNTLFLLFSHQLTEEQKNDAHRSFNITNFVPLPAELQAQFSHVPADLETLDHYLQPIVQWITTHAHHHTDYILIQGDFGATYYLVHFCKTNNCAQPIYATTERQAIETLQPDGNIKTERLFRHKRFRKY